jgi:hypothetical protein
MHKLIIAAAAAFAAPAFAQSPAYDDRIEDEIQRAIPPAEQVEAMAPTLDRMMGVLLNVDVGPLIDAADPYRRRADHGRRGRTLGTLGSADDPYFQDRMRSSIYGATADMGRMMQAFRSAAPGLARSMREMEGALGTAMEDYRRRDPAPPPEWSDKPPYPDE